MSEGADAEVDDETTRNVGCVIAAIAALVVVGIPVWVLGVIVRSKCGMYGPPEVSTWALDLVRFGEDTYAPLWLPLVALPTGAMLGGLVGKPFSAGREASGLGLRVAIGVVVLWDLAFAFLSC